MHWVTVSAVKLVFKEFLSDPLVALLLKLHNLHRKKAFKALFTSLYKLIPAWTLVFRVELEITAQYKTLLLPPAKSARLRPMLLVGQKKIIFFRGYRLFY